MPDAQADAACRRLDQFKSERGTLDAQLQDIADLVAPMRADFTQKERTLGTSRTDKQFDGTAGMAAENLGSGLWSALTNAGNQWFELEHEIEDLNKEFEVKEWLGECTSILTAAFGGNGNRFYASAVDLYLDVVSFGTGVFFMDMAEDGLWSSARHLAECYVAENDREQVDTVYREFKYTARQAEQKFTLEKLSEPLKNVLKTSPDQMVPFLHAVQPNKDFQPGRIGPKGKAWSSLYIELETKHTTREAGFEEFPFAVPRWSRRSRSAYGDSPAMLALADTKMLNAMEKTNIIAAQKAAAPPILAGSEDAFRGIRTAPDSIIYGAVDEQGRALVQPFNSGANMQLGLEMSDQRRAAIREAFYWSLMIMANQPNMTATEVMARQEEKIRLMGPYLGRLQSEFLDVVIERAFALMARRNKFPPPPEVVLRFPSIRPKYVSPLARAQKAGQASAVLRTWEVVERIAAVDPQVVDNFETDKMIRTVADANGLPADHMRDPKQIAKDRAAKAQQMQAEKMAAMAPPMAAAAVDGTQAMKNMAELPAAA